MQQKLTGAERLRRAFGSKGQKSGGRRGGIPIPIHTRSGAVLPGDWYDVEHAIPETEAEMHAFDAVKRR